LQQVPIARNRGQLGELSEYESKEREAGKDAPWARSYSAIMGSNKVIEAFGTSIISSSITERASDWKRNIGDPHWKEESDLPSEEVRERDKIGDFDANGVFPPSSMSKRL
jgi:hypothetical protein